MTNVLPPLKVRTVSLIIDLIRAIMAAKHNAIFRKMTFRTPEVTWLNNVQILIAISHNQEISSLLFMLDLYPFNVEDILLLDLAIFISFNNPDQLYLANLSILATITDVSVKILILVKVLTANIFINYSAIML